MYNLLVSADPDAWETGKYILPADRFLEHTTEALRKRFAKLDDDARAELRKLPCLFAFERNDGSGIREGRLSRVGWLTAIDTRGKEIRVSFILDDDVPPISTATLNGFEWELSIENREMFRTHWAVKEKDLAAVLELIAAGGPRAGARPYTLPPAVTPGLAPSQVLTPSQGGVPGRGIPQPRQLARATENAQQYRFIKKLDSGLHGKTCLFEDTVLRRNVAVKFLLEAADAEVDLLQQVQALARVEDAHVVRVYQYDTLLDPESKAPAGAVIMEFVDGATLRSLLRSGGISVGDALEIGGGVIRGVSAIHKNNLVHSDLHGENVLVAQGRHAKIIDLFYRGTLRRHRTWSREHQVERDLLDIGELLGELALITAPNIEAVDLFREHVRRPTPLREIGEAFIATMTAEKRGADRAAPTSTSHAKPPLPPPPGGGPPPPPSASAVLFGGLSEYGKQLLARAAEDPGGTILVTTTDDGLSVSTCGKEMVEQGPRARALWKKALAELQRKRLIIDTGGGEVFEVTAEGYDLLEDKY